MRRLSLLFVPPALGVFLACSAHDEARSAPESDLIGGRPALDAEFPATVLIKGNCTVTRVGPRHLLTAAHCVNNQPMFAAGATIEITGDNGIGKFAPEAGARGFKKYTVDKASMSPSWTELCPKLGGCGGVIVSGRNNMADAALIVLREDITDIPQAAIDLSPVAAGDAVVVTGYGCEDSVGATWDYSHQRLRVASTRVQAFDAVLHEGSFIFEEDRQSGLLAMLDGISVITPGGASARRPTDAGAPSEGGAPLRDAAASGDGGGRIDGGVLDGGARDAGAPVGPVDASQGGLCPGDSGGPLYRSDAPGLTVVGINANYTFSSGGSFPVGNHMYMYGGRPVTNWHTRVDGKRGLAVGAWLKGLGVRTVCTRGSCP